MVSKEDYIAKLKTVDPDMLVPFIVSEINSYLTGIRGLNISIVVELKRDKADMKEAIQQHTDLINQSIAELRIMLRAYEEFSEQQKNE